MGISDDLNAPLYLGGIITQDVPNVGPVAIAGHVYQIDPRQYARQTLEVLRGSADTGAEPGEQSLNTHGLWRRTGKDWRLGAGQRYFDDSDSDRVRFYASKGVDVFSTARQATLLNDTERKLTSAATNLKVLAIGSWLYLADGSSLRFTADPTPASPAFTTVAAPASILSLTTDGTSIWLASSGQPLQKATAGSGGAMAAFGTFAASVVGYGNGRLLAAALNRIVEVNAAGAVGGAGQLDYSHTNTNFVWRGMVATPGAIYAWGDAGGVSEVYSIVPDPSNGQLRPPAFAWACPLGETVNAMVWYSTVMLIGTTFGVRLATQNASSNTLTSGAAIEISGGVSGLTAYRNFAWFTWTNYDGTSTGIGRINLKLFVDTENLVPAYAGDLMATAQGAVLSVASFGDRRYFAVSGSGLWGQNANLVAAGTIDSGWLTFSTIERKVLQSVDLRHEALVGSISVEFALDTDPDNGGTWIGLSTSAAAGSTGPSSSFTASNQGFERARFRLTLNRSGTDATKGPTLRRWTARAIPTPYRTDEIIVPVRLFTEVLTSVPHGEGADLWQDVLGEFLYLKGFEGIGSIVRYQEGATSYDVYIDGIQLKPEKMTADANFFETLMLVRLLTVSPFS